MGRGLGDSGQGEWQPHHARHGTRMDKQPTILAVHSPSRIRNAIARVLPLATPLWVGPNGVAASFPQCSVYVYWCPTLCGPHRHIFIHLWHSNQILKSRISYNAIPTRRPCACSADRGGARTQIGRSPPASPVAWSAWIRQISRTQSTPRARSVARSRLYALRCIGDSKDSHLSRLSLVCCALLCLHSHTLVHG